MVTLHHSEGGGWSDLDPSEMRALGLSRVLEPKLWSEEAEALACRSDRH